MAVAFVEYSLIWLFGPDVPVMRLITSGLVLEKFATLLDVSSVLVNVPSMFAERRGMFANRCLRVG